MSAKNTEPEIQVRVFHTLTSQQYRKVEQQALSRISMRDESGPVQAGYLAGVHDTLLVLRNGFTTE